MSDNLLKSVAGREAIVAILREHDINPTAQRIDVAEYMLARPQHLSAEQVLHALQQAGHTVSKATIYNTLGLFVEKGLVREVNVDSSRAFYDSNTSRHHHFYNVDSGELRDIEGDSLQVANLPSIPPGTRMDSIDVIIRVRNTTD